MAALLESSASAKKKIASIKKIGEKQLSQNLTLLLGTKAICFVIDAAKYKKSTVFSWQEFIALLSHVGGLSHLVDGILDQIAADEDVVTKNETLLLSNSNLGDWLID